MCKRLAIAATIGAVAHVLLGPTVDSQPQRNIVIFVADGLRPGSVNATDAPTLLKVRTEGVNFINSHSGFPTLTMPNSAAIATGHCWQTRVFLLRHRRATNSPARTRLPAL